MRACVRACVYVCAYRIQASLDKQVAQPSLKKRRVCRNAEKCGEIGEFVEMQEIENGEFVETLKNWENGEFLEMRESGENGL